MKGTSLRSLFLKVSGLNSAIIISIDAYETFEGDMIQCSKKSWHILDFVFVSFNQLTKLTALLQ